MADRNHTPEPRSSQNNCLTILSHPVRIRDDFYSLNDLHAAAGGDSAHHPDRFLESPLARAWEASLVERFGGRARSALPQSEHGGSVSVFARRELAQGYALWVGESFALAVLRALGERPDPAALGSYPHTRYDLGYVRDLRWDEDRPGDIAWWEYDGQGALTAEEAAARGRDFFEQTRHLARTNPGDAEMALKHCLLRWFEGGFPGRGFHYCEMVFCDWLSRAAVTGMAAGDDGVSNAPGSG
ncbi:KilA-N domain-containing protein [Saccharospirillum salsuginis]|uniref:Uncharacterized protein n=1 Tax=Saccharospirillum salsuginis TaxID=418750 RepID=A0A918N507_9GAMM|nr:KilA-N domain-containing protein [Saccharospirillum salsuginis]GGX39944.1 hypothetical protein GCM10007392_03130 [Saccharospirillum salsuginis]